MHMEHCKPVEDAVYLHEGQHVLMLSGRAAVVADVGPVVIRFDYLGKHVKADDFVVIPRHKIPDMVRI